MKNIKRVFAIFLCLTIVMSFAGCGKNKTSSEDEWETVVSSTETVTGGDNIDADGAKSGSGNSDADSGSAVNKAFIKSLKGLEINIYTQQTEKPTRGTTSGDRYFAILNKIAKQYDVKINYLSDTITQEALQTSILSGQPLANVIGIQDYNFISWMNAGVAADLSSAMKKTGITFKEEHYNQDIRKLGNLNNKQYAFMSDVYSPNMIIYNKRMIQENGLTDPINLYKNGTWTFDKLTEYLRKLKKTGPDGSITVNGITCTTPAVPAALLISMNGGNAITISGGKLTADLNEAKVKNALSYLNTWYSVDKTMISKSNWKDAFKIFAQGGSAMAICTKYIFDAINEYNMTDAVGVVPFPYGPNASASTTYQYTQAFINIIPKCSEKDASKILFVMDQVYRQLYAVREQDFADSYRTLIRDNDSYNIFKDYTIGTKKMNLSYYNVSGIVFGDYQGLFNLPQSIAQGNTVETAINTHNKSISTGLTEQWGKFTVTGK